MKKILTLLLVAACFTASAQSDIEYPYNPDFENDGFVGIEDVLELLSVYGAPFTPEQLLLDGASLTEIIESLQTQIDSLASYTNDGFGALVLNDSLLTEYLVGVAAASEEGDSTLAAWVMQLSEVVEQQQAQIDSLLSNDVDSAAQDWHLSCIDFGLGISCSPHSGLCPSVSNDPEDDGSYPISYSCNSNFDPSQCWSPTWRRFRIESSQAELITSLKGERVGNTQNSNGYFSYIDDFDIGFELVGNGIEFVVWSGDIQDGFVGLNIGDQHNSISRWTMTYFSLFAIVDGRVTTLPFKIHF